jgi:branched-subunit amino acid aminotransferase/4-amino-4-deoxychorismate lyase
MEQRNCWPEHLARWAASAELLGMNPPPSQQDLSGLIDEAIVKKRPGIRPVEPCA